MTRLAALTLITAVATTSCAGGGSSHFLPGAAGSGTRGGQAVQSAVVAPPGWAATATRGATLPSGSDRGALSPSTPLTVRVGLNLHHDDPLRSLIAAGQRISPGQFAAQFGPTPSEVQSVVTYLQSQGFTNVQASTQLVSADGTAAIASKAFNTTL